MFKSHDIYSDGRDVMAYLESMGWTEEYSYRVLEVMLLKFSEMFNDPPNPLREEVLLDNFQQRLMYDTISVFVPSDPEFIN